jgi:hypothetical protein
LSEKTAIVDLATGPGTATCKRQAARTTTRETGALALRQKNRHPTMRGAASLLLLLLPLLLGLFRPADAQVKLIHYGWDNQYITNLPGAVMGKFRRSAFDGIAVYATEYSLVFAATTHPADVHDWDKEVLDTKLDKALLRNSYILVHGMTDGVFDWTSDDHWSASLNNMQMLANLAKHGTFKGIVFDMEPYGRSEGRSILRRESKVVLSSAPAEAASG